jgi:NAD(P)-dependent dehydrogenase (short-subunit alcohol dehydrogenase family)
MLSSGIGVAAADFLPVVCDVTKEAEVVNLPKIITKHWPDAGIDVLVNNAGAARISGDRRVCWLAGMPAGCE